MKNKILTPKYLALKKEECSVSFLKKLLKNKRIPFPIVVKPINEGSSLGVKICKDINELIKSSKTLYKYYTQLLFEQYMGDKKFKLQY